MLIIIKTITFAGAAAALAESFLEAPETGD
jgi:hypothetical protein